MKKGKIVSGLTFLVGIAMLTLGFSIQQDMLSVDYSEPIIQEYDIRNMAASANKIIAPADEEQPQEEATVEEAKEEDNNLLLKDVSMETAPASVVIVDKPYDEMTIEEVQTGLNEGTLTLKYSEVYTNSSTRLTKSKGALYFNGHKETYYSQNVLPGTSLRIPGRHVADDGTIRDGDGYICVAADSGYLSRGSVVITSLGPGKVYDTGCAYGVIDIYTNW